MAQNPLADGFIIICVSNPYKIRAGGPAANKAYHNDVVLDTICQYVDRDTAKMSLLVASKKLFVQAAKIMYHEAEEDILTKLHERWSNYHRLCVYLQAIRVISISDTFPTDIDVPLLRNRFPNLMRIDFSLRDEGWGDLEAGGSIYPYDEAVSGERFPQRHDGMEENRILGGIFLYIAWGDQRIYDPAFGIHGPAARFHLLGLRLACCSGSAAHEYCGEMIQEGSALDAITPVEVDKPEAKSLLVVWRDTFKHLEFLTIANGIEADDIPFIVQCAPKLRHLRAWVPGLDDEDDEWDEGSESDEDENGGADGGGKRVPLLLQVEKTWPDKVWDILEINESADDPQLDKLLGRFSVRHASLSWNLATVKPSYLARYETFEDWKRHLNPLRLGSSLETIRLQIPDGYEGWDHHAVGTALSVMIPPHVKVILHNPDSDVYFHRWVGHVLNNRLRVIEQDRGREKKGYRLIDAEIMPASPGHAGLPDTPDEAGKLKVDKVWSALSASGKYAVLRRGGAIGTGYYEHRRYGGLHDTDEEGSRGFMTAAQRYRQ